MSSSAISLRLLLCVIVLFLAVVYKLNGIGVLPSGHRLFAHLIGDEGLAVLDIIELTISKTDVIPFIKSTPDRGEEVGTGDEEKLGHVENVKELHTVTSIEPHPISVRLQADSLESK